MVSRTYVHLSPSRLRSHPLLGIHPAALNKALACDVENVPAQAEAKVIEALLRDCRRKYGTNRRAEFDGRMAQHDSYGLTQDDAEMCFRAGTMPWDPAVNAVAKTNGSFGAGIGMVARRMDVDDGTGRGTTRKGRWCNCVFPMFLPPDWADGEMPPYDVTENWRPLLLEEMTTH